MDVKPKPINFIIENAIANLLSSNGVDLNKAIRGRDIMYKISSGLSWTISSNETRCKENEVKELPPTVLNSLKNNAVLKEDGVYVCSGGCTQGKNNGLMVFTTVAYKENEDIILMILTSDQNISLAPEVWARDVTTIQPIVATGKYTVSFGSLQFEYPYQEIIGKIVSTFRDVKLKERRLNDDDLAALRDFCLVNICQKFLGRERCERVQCPDEIRQILTYDFGKSFMKSEPPSTRVDEVVEDAVANKPWYNWSRYTSAGKSKSTTSKETDGCANVGQHLKPVDQMTNQNQQHFKEVPHGQRLSQNSRMEEGYFAQQQLHESQSLQPQHSVTRQHSDQQSHQYMQDPQYNNQFPDNVALERQQGYQYAQDQQMRERPPQKNQNAQANQQYNPAQMICAPAADPTGTVNQTSEFCGYCGSRKPISFPVSSTF